MNKLAGITTEKYRALFLEQKAFGQAMRMTQDNRENGPDPGNRSFAKHRGIQAGFTVWMGNSEKPIWRVVDIRFVFPTEGAASAFHLERLLENSEGQPPVTDAPKVGSECHVFGGESIAQAPGTIAITMTAFYYIFRVRNVVVKFFAAQGPGTEEPLTPAMMIPIAKKIVARIESQADA
jgi:hypothetical protein